MADIGINIQYGRSYVINNQYSELLRINIQYVVSCVGKIQHEEE